MIVAACDIISMSPTATCRILTLQPAMTFCDVQLTSECLIKPHPGQPPETMHLVTCYLFPLTSLLAHFKLRNHPIVLHSGQTDGQNPIMGEAELRHFKDAFLLSNHIFEAIQHEMKAADPMQSYEKVRGELSKMAGLIAGGLGKQVTNLQIQLSVLCRWPLAAMHATLKRWTSERQLSEYLAACDTDIKMWHRIPSTPKEAFYSALRKVSSDSERNLRSPAMCERVKRFLEVFASRIPVLFPATEVEESSEQSSDVDGSDDPEGHQTHLCIPDADGADFSERERRLLVDTLYDMLTGMGIGNDAAFSILSGSLWIVISTLAPLDDKQQSALVATLNMYVKKCKSGKNGPTSACAWMFAKAVQLTNGALVPINVLNRVRLARDLQKKLQGPTADASRSTWLDANGIKAMATAVYNSSEGRSVISERQVRLFHHGQELQGHELLRSAADIQITVEEMWEELTWPAALEETMQKISQRQDAKEMPWARSKSFQDFALALYGICSSPDAALRGLCIQGLQDVLQSDKFMDSCTTPLALLTEAPGPWFCFNSWSHFKATSWQSCQVFPNFDNIYLFVQIDINGINYITLP